MKLPKHRTNLYLVTRCDLNRGSSFVVGVFRTEEGAQSFADNSVQAFTDGGISDFTFPVRIVTYYDE